MRPFGVLALQGDFAAHARALGSLGVTVREVRRTHQLEGLAGLVLPGGESTTLLKLMADEPWFEAVRRFHAKGGALLGTCAGAILLSREVVPQQPCLALLDAVIERNAYGRQIDSFEARIEAPSLDVVGVFIRAPRFRSVGAGVRILGRHQGEPVLVGTDGVLAATFHPELTGSPGIHRLLVEMAEARGPVSPTGRREAAARRPSGARRSARVSSPARAAPGSGPARKRRTPAR